MKVQFFLLLTGILVVAQSYGAAVANIKLGTEMNSFLDAKGNYHIVFVASVDDCHGAIRG